MNWIAVLVTVLATCSPVLGQYCHCACCTTGSINVRDTPCGNVVGSATPGQCFDSTNEIVGCWLGGTYYDFVAISFQGQEAWIATDYTESEDPARCSSDSPEQELRSFFLTTVWNIDWPESGWDSVSKQQEDLIEYLNLASDLKMNVIMFQVRGAGDAMYDSPIEPWSTYLTGTQGTPPNPYWDPLTFIIDECHARNIELHVWLNPYRAHVNTNRGELASNHKCNVAPTSQYCYTYSSYLWMDPGAEDVVVHLENVITDILTRYDVDGLHFDDYFYPYPDDTDFPDDSTWNEYVSGGGQLSRDDWRRDNVNRMVQRVNNLVHSTKPGSMFSISPFGLYRPCHEDGMPCHITGFDPYEGQYADSKLWLQSGWLDALIPQIYWHIDSSGQPYDDILEWWVQQNTANRHVHGANAAYKMADSNDWPSSELEQQVLVTRQWNDQRCMGNVFYSAQHFRDNVKGITDLFKAGVYSEDASVPERDWLRK